jgi:multidrug resistance efflux pump
MVDDGDAVMAGDLLMVLEKTQARASFEVLQGQKRLLAAKRIAQLKEEIAGLESQISNQRQQLELIDEEIASMESLVERGMLARPQYLAMRRRKAEVEGQMAENVANVARARQSIGETGLQIVSLGSVRLDEIVTELAETRSELAAVDERTLLRYLVQPVLDSLRRSFRES